MDIGDLAHRLGLDVQRPLATVIVWGLSSAAILTLFVVPVLYFIVSPRIQLTLGLEPDASLFAHS